jgi:hypothetical protein
MKSIAFACFLVLFLANACTKSSRSVESMSGSKDSLDSLRAADSLQALANARPPLVARLSRASSQWIIPAALPVDGTPPYVFIIPKGEKGLPLYKDTTSFGRTNIAGYVADTTQAKILDLRKVKGKGVCKYDEYYELEVGPEKKHGWIWSGNVMDVGVRTLAFFDLGGHSLTLGSMTTISKKDIQERCHTVTTFFCYTDTAIYMIDISRLKKGSPASHWGKEKYFSLRDADEYHRPMTREEQGQILLEWEVPGANANAQLMIGFTDHVVANYFSLNKKEVIEEQGEEQGDEEVIDERGDAETGD